MQLTELCETVSTDNQKGTATKNTKHPQFQKAELIAPLVVLVCNCVMMHGPTDQDICRYNGSFSKPAPASNQCVLPHRRELSLCVPCADINNIIKPRTAKCKLLSWEGCPVFGDGATNHVIGSTSAEYQAGILKHFTVTELVLQRVSFWTRCWLHNCFEFTRRLGLPTSQFQKNEMLETK